MFSKRRIATALFIISPLLLTEAAAQSQLTAFRGTVLNVSFSIHPWANAIKQYFPEFEKATGIKINLSMAPEADFRKALNTAMASKGDQVDVYMTSPGQEGLMFHKNGWSTELTPYIKNPKLTPANWSFQDFFNSLLTTGVFGGKLTSIPVQAETPLLFYRKDVFARYGVAVPRTLAELEAAAKALNGKDGMVGIALRGKGASATSQFSPYMFSYGSDWLDTQGKANFNDPKFVEAMKFYTGLLNSYGPKNATEMSWQEVTKMFGQSKVAMFTDASLFRSIVDDPTSSTVVGKVGYALFPSGPAGRHPYVTVWGLGISQFSKNKEAAWLFVQWASNRQNQLRALMEDVPVARRSAWNNPLFVKQDKHPEWTNMHLLQVDKAEVNWNPPVVSVGDVRNVLGEAIVGALQGGNVDSLLRKANDQTNTIIERDR